MALFSVTVHLSSDFRRTCFLRDVAEFEQCALDGVYDGRGFDLKVEAADHLAAAEIAFAVCNSYPDDEMFAAEQYAGSVFRYRAGGNRGLSVGDLLMITREDTWSESKTTDGRYGVAGVGFVKF